MESHHSHKVCAVECSTCSILVEDSVASVPIERGTDDPLISSQERHREEHPHFPVSLGEAKIKIPLKKICQDSRQFKSGYKSFLAFDNGNRSLLVIIVFLSFGEIIRFNHRNMPCTQRQKV